MGLFATAILGVQGWPDNLPDGTTWGTKFDIWLGNVSGWVDPATSFSFSGAVLGSILTITIAVSFATSGGTVIDQVETTFWSTVLTAFSFGAAMVAVIVSSIAWASVPGEPRSAVGTAVVSTLIAFGCVALSASIRLNIDNAAMRRRTISQIEQKIKQLEDDRTTIFGTAPRIGQRTWRTTLTLLSHYIAVSLSGTAIGVVMNLIGSMIGSSQASLSVGEVLAMSISVLTTTAVIWFVVYLRWSDYRLMTRWKRETSSNIIAALWIALIALLVYAIPANDRWAIVTSGVLPLVQAILVSIARPNRQLWPLVRPFRWLARPVWNEVDRRLYSQIDRSQVRLDERLNAPISA